jgi:hypothetical protein
MKRGPSGKQTGYHYLTDNSITGETSWTSKSTGRMPSISSKLVTCHHMLHHSCMPSPMLHLWYMPSPMLHLSCMPSPMLHLSCMPSISTIAYPGIPHPLSNQGWPDGYCPYPDIAHMAGLVLWAGIRWQHPFPWV